jgi:flagellar protein FlbB
MAKSNQTQKNKTNKFPKIFFAIFLPFIFLLTLALIVLTLLGFNVFEEGEKYASKIPGISQVASSDEQESTEDEEARLQAIIANKDAELEDLQGEVDQKQSVISELEQEVIQLETELQDVVDGNENESADEKSKELARSFEGMDAEEAASIVENMDQSIAVKIMAHVASEERGEILGKMDPELAADISVLLIEE